MSFEALKNSVITRAELSHQQPCRRRWLTVFYGVMILLGALCFAMNFIFEPTLSTRADAVGAILAVYYILVTIFHFGLMFYTLKLSSEAIMREKRNSERWDTLLLTGVSGRELVVGKWWAIVQTLWRPYLLLGFLRVAAAVTFPTIGRGLNPFYVYFSIDLLSVTIEGVILATVTLVSLTVMSLPYTAACGVFTAMWLKNSDIARAFVVRTVITFAVAMLPMLLWSFIGLRLLVMNGRMSDDLYNRIAGFNSYLASLLLHNGMNVAADIAANNYWMINYSVIVACAFAGALVIYVVLAWVLLRVAQWRAERSGALRQREAR